MTRLIKSKGYIIFLLLSLFLVAGSKEFVAVDAPTQGGVGFRVKQTTDSKPKPEEPIGKGDGSPTNSFPQTGEQSQTFGIIVGLILVLGVLFFWIKKRRNDDK